MIIFQNELRPAPPDPNGPKEFRNFQDKLIEMDRILDSGIEHDFIKKKIQDYPSLSSKVLHKLYNSIRIALRFAILLCLTGDSSRELAIRVSDSPLLQWFTTFSLIFKGTSKSAIDRHEKRFTSQEIEDLLHTTCIKADIHFPVDWILLRDAACSIIGCIEVIRNHGLKHRIGEPREFVRQMNSLVMQMTHTRKKKNGQMLRKKILRQMNRLGSPGRNLSVLNSDSLKAISLLTRSREQDGRIPSEKNSARIVTPSIFLLHTSINT